MQNVPSRPAPSHLFGIHLSRYGGRAFFASAGFVALYLLLAWLTYTRPALKPAITPWNPQTGLAIAFLSIWGLRYLPVVAVAIVVADIVIRAYGSSLPVTLTSGIWIALVYGVLALTLQRARVSGPIESVSAAGKLSASVFVAALLAAAGSIAVFVAFGDVAPADASRGIARLAFADTNGILVTAPLVALASRWRGAVSSIRLRRAEAFAQLITLLLTLLMVFSLPAADQLRFFYLLFIPVIWIALRWHVAGGLIAVLAIHSALIAAARLELHTPRFIDLQVLLLTLSLTALFLGALATARTRAEQRAREKDAELAGAMRFAVAGELASALAHELNQPMTALVSYLEAAEILAKRTQTPDDRLDATLGKSLREAMRASDILNRLQAFYRTGAHKREPVQLTVLVPAVIGAFQERARMAEVQLEYVADPTLPQIEGDATQIEIVLHNLLANAMDAVIQAPGSERRILLDARHDTHGIQIRVEDSGRGIDEDIAAKLFEPFITGKPDGMGLGLAISRSLVRAQSGDITCERSPRLSGAAFIIRLPASLPKT